MKTDQLIDLLAADAPAKPVRLDRRTAGAVAATAAIIVAVVVVRFGLRPDFGTLAGLAPMLLKQAVTLGIAIGAAVALARLLSPGRAVGAALVPAVAGAALLAVWLAFDAAALGLADLGRRTVGVSAAQCVTAIALLACLPLAGLLAVARAGAVTQPRLAGALAGLASAGLASAAYALYCTEDSPFFVAAWYGLAAAGAAALGAALFDRLARW